MVVLRADAKPLDREMKKAQESVRGLDAAFKKGMASMNALVASVATVQAAIAGAQKYIQSSQSTTDEWGRTMAAASRSVDHFFESLSQGDFSGFLSGLDKVIDRAKAAYNALDDLGTANIFAEPLQSKYQKQIDQLRYNIKAGIGDVDTQKREIRDIEKKQLALNMELAKKNRNAYIASMRSLVGDAGSDQELIDYGYGGLASQENRKKAAIAYRKKHLIKEAGMKTSGMGMNATIVATPEIWDNQKNKDRWRFLNKLGEANDDDLKKNFSFLSAAEALEGSVYRRKAENLEVLNRKSPTDPSPATKKFPKDYDPATGMILPNAPVPQFSDIPIKVTSSMSELKRRLADAQKELDESVNADQAASAGEKIKHIQDLIDVQPLALRLDMNEADVANIQKTMENMNEKISNSVKPLELPPIGDVAYRSLKKTDQEIQAMKDSISSTIGAFGSLGSAMQNLDDPSAQVAGLVMQAIANVAATFAKSLAGTATPWDWIAAAIAGTATMTSTIVAIKSATSGSYADGGIIPGNSRMGDAIPIMANAGEVILNAAQQQNLVSKLEPRYDFPGGGGRSTISGEQIVTVVNAYGRRTGRGEILK